jgi:protein required for attachment to host cells
LHSGATRAQVHSARVVERGKSNTIGHLLLFKEKKKKRQREGLRRSHDRPSTEHDVVHREERDHAARTSETQTRLVVDGIIHLLTVLSI